MAEERLRIGGLMRCCTGTWEKARNEGALTGQTSLGCQYCSGGMQKADDGIWEWDRDYVKDAKQVQEEKEEKKEREPLKFRVMSWIPVELDESVESYDTFDEARADRNQVQEMQPENKYEVQVWINGEWMHYE